MINILIPMAGEGSRFINAGYTTPKPFIDVAGKTMIERVLENLSYPNARYILIGRTKHLEKEKKLVQKIEEKYNALFIQIDYLTEGTACTVLYARKHLNLDAPLLIANSDQIVDMNIADFILDCKARNLDGSILTFVDKQKDTKWSFAKLDDNLMVTEVAEKKAISEFATVGIYLYTRTRDFVEATVDMIIKKDRVKGEFYTCPTYNYAIRNGLKIGIYNIKFNQMHGLGTPDDLNLYLNQFKYN